MKEVKVSSVAREEMAREKARIMGLKKKRISPLEQVAIQWRRKKEAEKIRVGRQGRTQREEESPTISPQQIFPQPKALDNRTRLAKKESVEAEAVEWKQYNPWQEEQEETGKKRTVSSASIWVFAKRLIAREWARALGRKKEDPWIYALEQEAREWKEREKKRVEEERKVERQKERLQESLGLFGKKLLQREQKEENMALELFEDALKNVGEVVDVQWLEDGCLVQIEPWEEKRLRRKRGDTLPVIYGLKINKELEITSYSRLNQT